MLCTQYKQVYEQDIDLPSGKSFNQGNQITRINCNWDSVYYDPENKGYGDDPVLTQRVYDNAPVVARILLEDRATQYAPKHIDVEPRDMSRLSKLSAMVHKRAIFAWGKKHGLAKFFNDVTFTRAKYGGALAKKTKEDVTVVPWENVITDQTDILNNPIIERHYMLPSEVLAMTSWKNTKDVVKFGARKSRDASLAKHNGKDNNQSAGRQIEIYELTGEITLRELKDAQDNMGIDVEHDEDDDFTYVFAKVIECGNFTLYAEEVGGEMKDYYRYIPRNAQSGRGIGQSLYEQLSEHQRWHNFTKTEEMRMLAIVGKLSSMVLTDDSSVLKQLTNVLSDKVQHGSVLLRSPNTTMQQFNATPSTLPAYQNVRNEWDMGSDDKTSSHAAMTGGEQKAGTPFRAQALQNQMSGTQFTKYRDEIGTLFLLPILEDWISPMAIKEAEDDLFDTFSAEELAFIDATYTSEKQKEMYITKTLMGERVTDDDMFAVQLGVEVELAKMGTRRRIDGVRKFLKESIGRVVLHINDEYREKAVLYETFANLLNYLDPADPRANAIKDRIMAMAGITDEELRVYENRAKEEQQKQLAMQPQPQQQLSAPSPTMA